ncbi:MAG TPA: hypothetical protein VHQ01_11570 [Pyrinomonadaceae bacterium]|nr:hypothetical protein [Pyrinomonadaceae bacterium]
MIVVRSVYGSIVGDGVGVGVSVGHGVGVGDGVSVFFGNIGNGFIVGAVISLNVDVLEKASPPPSGQLTKANTIVTTITAIMYVVIVLYDIKSSLMGLLSFSLDLYKAGPLFARIQMNEDRLSGFDQAQWFDILTAREKINLARSVFLDELAERIAE